VDEKTAIQALDRLDPVLPLSPGRAERHGFEYYRHGTLSLYAALDTASGRVHGKTAASHTSRDLRGIKVGPQYCGPTSGSSNEPAANSTLCGNSIQSDATIRPIAPTAARRWAGPSGLSH
jgi:hypothetical protein